jgi:hypothetical protein
MKNIITNIVGFSFWIAIIYQIQTTIEKTWVDIALYGVLFIFGGALFIVDNASLKEFFRLALNKFKK